MTFSTLPLEPDDPIHDVGPAPLAILSTRPDAVMALAHEKLYTSPFNEVRVCWRRLYEEASIYKAVSIIEANHAPSASTPGSKPDPDADWKASVIRILDMAIILTGSPGRRETIDALLADLDDPHATTPPPQPQSPSPSPDDHPPRAAKRARTSHEPAAPPTFPSSLRPRHPILHALIPRHHKPSLAFFQTHVLNHSPGPTPLILTDTLTHWPALTRWRDPRYWLRRTHGGRRLVPIELGRAYTDDGWGQRIVPFGEYLRRWLLDETTTAPTTPPANDDTHDTHATHVPSTAYLAQYDMLSQIPRLRADIAVPDYCYIDTGRPASASSSSSSDNDTNIQLNLWLGPAASISPLHTDPHHNLLAQVLGTKYVRLYAPAETSNVYPMATSAATIDMSNTASVDISLCVDWAGEDAPLRTRTAQDAAYPRLARARFVDCVLEPGEVLFVPRGWWHYVEAFPGQAGSAVSCSVSFWWD